MADPTAEIVSTTYKGDYVTVVLKVKMERVEFTYSALYEASSFPKKEDAENKAKMELAIELEILWKKLKAGILS